jgi:DNA-binding NtrC family response regulator
VIEHVGGRKSIPVDVRILSATNKNLESEIRKGTFREDLYYRLKVIHVQMPALREIRQDIPDLANYLLANYCRETKKEPMHLAPQAAAACMDYTWPGNFRELENEMRRLVLSVSGNTVAPEDLSEAIRRSGTAVAASLSTSRLLKDVVSEIERRMIQEALQQSKQNQLHAAKVLGLSRHGLIKKMKRYNIRLRDA